MVSQRQSYVYMMSNVNNTVLYIGVTAQLAIRVHQHKRGETESFTQRYSLTHLVWFETFGDVRNAIAREKQLKGWKRSRKNALVAAQNPEWRDLAADW